MGRWKTKGISCPANGSSQWPCRNYVLHLRLELYKQTAFGMNIGRAPCNGEESYVDSTIIASRLLSAAGQRLEANCCWNTGTAATSHIILVSQTYDMPHGL